MLWRNPESQMSYSPSVEALLEEGPLIPLVDVAERCGVSISWRTAMRWTLEGLRGVRLESAKVAGRRVTSPQAVVRFLAATQDLPPKKRGQQRPSTPPRPRRTAPRQAARARQAIGRKHGR